MRITRRKFVSAGLALPAVLASRGWAAGTADITVGITVDTRPDWNGAENFIRSIDEASAAGFHHVETFWNYVERWEHNPQGLKDELARRGLRLETVSNGGRMRVNFVDPRERAATIEDHMKLVSLTAITSRSTAAAGQRTSTSAAPNTAATWRSASTSLASASPTWA
jgi:sugar phosphate isomerase/epimerase